jgi:hypothetical protein
VYNFDSLSQQVSISSKFGYLRNYIFHLIKRRSDFIENPVVRQLAEEGLNGSNGKDYYDTEARSRTLGHYKKGTPGRRSE